jgi:hypothetical protein
MEIRRVFTIHKRAAVFPFLLLAFCPFLHGQRSLKLPKLPTTEVWGGYSYLRFDATKLGFADRLTLNGGEFGVSLPDLYYGLGVDADISGHYTREMEEFNFLIGPQYTFQWKGIRLQGHGLFGKARDRLRLPGTTQVEPSDLHKAMAFGGGLDFPLGQRFSLRAVQGDYLRTWAFGTTQQNIRISTGLIVRFGKR